jgi:WD40 repeat protein
MLATNGALDHRRCGEPVRGVLGAILLFGVCALLGGVPAAVAGDEPVTWPSRLDSLNADDIPAEVRLDKQPRELVAVFGRRIHEGSRNSVTFTPDGKLLVSCRDGTDARAVVLYHTATTREMAVLRGHKLSVRAVAVSPDGKTLASAGGELDGGGPPGGGELRLWDLSGENPKLQAELAGHTDIVFSVAFSPDGKTLASVSRDKTVRLWDLSGQKPAEKVKLPVTLFNYYSVSFSPDGKMLATPEEFWSLGGEKPEKRAALYSSVYRGTGGNAVAFAPDGKHLAVGTGNDRTVLVWGLDGDKLTKPIELNAFGEEPVDPLLSMAIAPDSRRLAQCNGDRVILWDMGGKKLKEWRLTPNLFTSLVFAPDGRHLAVANEKGLVYILRLPK